MTLDPSQAGGRVTGLTVGVPVEIKSDEYRVALTPDGVRELHGHGSVVLVEAGAGAGAAIPDEDFARAGAEIVASAAEVWMKPGDTVFTRTPCGASSFDRPLLYVRRAALAAAYPSVPSYRGIRP